MADHDLKISITTVANTAGADAAIGSMERIEQKARAAGAAVEASRHAAEREGPLTELQKLEYELAAITAEAKVLDAALAKVQASGGNAAGLARQVEQRDTQAGMLVAQIEALGNAGGKAEAALKPLRELHDLQPKIGAGGRNMGQAMLQVGYAMQDAQYGMRGVINNIPSILMYMGGGAGLAGVATLAAVAVSTLGPAFANMFSDDPSGRLKKLTDQLAELKKHSEETRKELAKENEKKWFDSLQDDTRAFQALNDEIARNISLEQNRRRNKIEEESSQAALDMAEIDANPNMSEPDKIRARARIQSDLAKSKAADRVTTEKETAELARSKAGNVTADHFLAEKDLGEVTQREADAKARAADLRAMQRAASDDARQVEEAQKELEKLQPHGSVAGRAGARTLSPEEQKRRAELQDIVQRKGPQFTGRNQEELDTLAGKEGKGGGLIDTLKSERESAQKAADAKASAAEAARRDAIAAGQRAADNAATIERNAAREERARQLTTGHAATTAQTALQKEVDAREHAAVKDANDANLALRQDRLQSEASVTGGKWKGANTPNAGLTKTMRGIGQKLADGTDAKEIAALQEQFDAATKSMGGATIAALKAMLASLQKQATDIETLKKQMKNN